MKMKIFSQKKKRICFVGPSQNLTKKLMTIYFQVVNNSHNLIIYDLKLVNFCIIMD